MPRRRPSNLLALAVLALLTERPMHPYEMSATLRERSKETSIKLNYGSLYTVVESLARSGLIRARETVREGRRPERTIYEITESGNTELYDWMSELMAVPVKEYTRFEAALALIVVLTPRDAARLLTERRMRLAVSLQQAQATLDLATRTGLPRIFTIEGEYTTAVAEAEARFVDGLLDEIRNRTLSGIHFWDAMHRPEEEQTHDRMAAALAADRIGGPAADHILDVADRNQAAAGFAPSPAGRSGPEPTAPTEPTEPTAPPEATELAEPEGEP
jgi:DNA-binding PadR family transcriptional regulator